MLLKFTQNEFALVSAARLVERGIGMLGAVRDAAEKLGRKMVRLDARLRADNDQALDEVAQLAHVSGPRMTQQDFHGGIAELTGFLAVRGAELVQEVAREDGNVFFAITQGRHEKGNYVEAVKEILAESATGDFLLEILVGGGENTNVHGQSLAGADGLEALLFEDAQDLRLRAQAH